MIPLSRALPNLASTSYAILLPSSLPPPPCLYPPFPLPALPLSSDLFPSRMTHHRRLVAADTLSLQHGMESVRVGVQLRTSLQQGRFVGQGWGMVTQCTPARMYGA